MRRYLTGGAVRDQLLGRAAADRDWLLTGTNAAALESAGYRPVGKGFTAFLHPHSNEEYALPRGPAEVRGELETVTADLARRDLTVNSMALSESGELIDPFGGVQDLNDRVLRHTSSYFSDDAVRVLRVARLSAKLDFTIAAETLELCQQLCEQGQLHALPSERIAQELLRALCGPNPARFLDSLKQLGIAKHLLPELNNFFLNQGDGLLRRPEQLACALRAAATQGLNEIQRYALFAQGAGATAVDASMHKRLGVPNAHMRLAQSLCVTHAVLRRGRSSPAEEFYTALHRAGVFSTDSSLAALLECIAACDISSQANSENWADSADWAHAAARAAVAVTSAKVVNKYAHSNLPAPSGQALGDALRAERTAAIAALA
jgi:tRNA nucleotidyltransferase (CCA-adding enzyme)